MRSNSLKSLVLGAALLGVASLAHAQWIAINDFGAGPGTPTNATTYSHLGTSSGPLVDINAGVTLPVTVNITSAGSVSDVIGFAPVTGTPLADTFAGLVDWAGAAANNAIISSVGNVTYTFTGLNPTNKYVIQGGAVRGGDVSSITNRWTLFSLNGADGYTSAHSSGAYTTAKDPAILANQVALNTGANRLTGDMFEWREVQPGNDGTIQLVCTSYRKFSGPVGFGYVPTALRIVEAVAGPPVIVAQPQSQLANIGQSVTFRVGALGSPLFYQWFRNGLPMPGQTNATFIIPSVGTIHENVAFTVDVYNNQGRVTSLPAYVIIQKPPQQLVAWNKVWQYDRNAVNLGTDWREVNYGGFAGNLSGPGPLGFESATLPVPLATTFASHNSWTYYFRTTFNFTGEPTDVELVLTNLLDDGAVYYLNGVEIARLGMPEGDIDYSTPAGRTVGDATTFETLTASAASLVKGTNVLAVEVHQTSTTSSDMVFGLNLWARFLPPQPLTILTQPKDLVVEELKPAEFSVSVQGNGARFQWFKDDVAIAGADRATLTIPETLGTDSGEYYVRVSNPFSLLNSERVTLTVLADTNGPVILVADGTISTTNILVSFSEKVQESGATNRANYRLTTTEMTPNLTIVSGIVTNGTNVLLTTAPRSQGVNYLIVVNNLRDVSPQNNLITPNSMVPVSSEIDLISWFKNWYIYEPFLGVDPAYPGDGWNTNPAFSVSSWAFDNLPAHYDDLENDVPLPGTKDDWHSLGQGALTRYFRTSFFFSASPLGASFRLRHVVDDGAIFYLNGTEVIRFNMPDGPVDPSDTASAAIGIPKLISIQDIPASLLQAGDNLVAVELHDMSSADTDYIFGMEFKIRINSLVQGPVVITRQPQNQTVQEGKPVTFTFDGAGPRWFQWYKNNLPITGATNPTYTILSSSFADNAALFKVRAQNSSSSVFSSNAVLTVTVDNDRPELVGGTTLPTLDGVLLSFSEFIDLTTAQDPDNYVITNAVGGIIPVVSATVTNGTNVVLATGAMPYSGGVVLVSNVRDTSLAGNVILPNFGVVLGYGGPIISRDAEWTYDESRRDFLSEGEWLTLGFNDSDWLTGSGVFAYPAGEGMPGGWTRQTTLAYGDGSAYHTNYYFRTILNLPGGLAGTVTVTNILDDGAVYWLNGEIISRFRVTADPVTVTTFSAGRTDDVGTAANPYDVIELEGSDFADGQNVICVSVHQSSATSSDVVFGSEWWLSFPSRIIRPPDFPSDCPDLQVEYVNGSVRISWPQDSGCILIEATSFDGPWTEVSSQANPYTVTPAGQAKFYQLWNGQGTLP